MMGMSSSESKAASAALISMTTVVLPEAVMLVTSDSRSR